MFVCLMVFCFRKKGLQCTNALHVKKVSALTRATSQETHFTNPMLMFQANGHTITILVPLPGGKSYRLLKRPCRRQTRTQHKRTGRTKLTTKKKENIHYFFIWVGRTWTVFTRCMYLRRSRQRYMWRLPLIRPILETKSWTQWIHLHATHK